MKQAGICVAAAGCCPKPERTYGEPHYCELPHYHEGWPHGSHKCRRCGMEFNCNSVAPYWLIEGQKKADGGASR